MTVTEFIHRTRPANIRLEALTSREPGRGRLWAVEIGRWFADGKTEKAAIDQLTGRLAAFLADYRHPEVVSFRGYTAVISLDISQSSNASCWWSELVVAPNGAQTYSGVSAGSWEEATARARYNLAQRTTDWHDDASVHAAAAYVAEKPWKPADPNATLNWFNAEELYRYAAWQRAAKHAMDSGEADWHEWASLNWHKFEFTRPATN